MCQCGIAYEGFSALCCRVLERESLSKKLRFGFFFYFNSDQ